MKSCEMWNWVVILGRTRPGQHVAVQSHFDSTTKLNFFNNNNNNNPVVLSAPQNAAHRSHGQGSTGPIRVNPLVQIFIFLRVNPPEVHSSTRDEPVKAQCIVSKKQPGKVMWRERERERERGIVHTTILRGCLRYQRSCYN